MQYLNMNTKVQINKYEYIYGSSRCCIFYIVVADGIHLRIHKANNTLHKAYNEAMCFVHGFKGRDWYKKYLEKYINNVFEIGDGYCIYRIFKSRCIYGRIQKISVLNIKLQIDQCVFRALEIAYLEFVNKYGIKPMF